MNKKTKILSSLLILLSFAVCTQAAEDPSEFFDSKYKMLSLVVDSADKKHPDYKNWNKLFSEDNMALEKENLMVLVETFRKISPFLDDLRKNALVKRKKAKKTIKKSLFIRHGGKGSDDGYCHKFFPSVVIGCKGNKTAASIGYGERYTDEEILQVFMNVVNNTVFPGTADRHFTEADVRRFILLKTDADLFNAIRKKQTEVFKNRKK